MLLRGKRLEDRRNNLGPLGELSLPSRIQAKGADGIRQSRDNLRAFNQHVEDKSQNGYD